VPQKEIFEYKLPFVFNFNDKNLIEKILIISQRDFM